MTTTTGSAAMNATSDSIGKLAEALANAQGQITGALKDSNNPFFKSKYADLAACWDACRKPLADNGLAVIQSTAEADGRLYVVTTLAHSSGEWLRGWMPVKVKDDGPQAMGSGITYARRYALAAMVGLAQIDDDAESAQGRTNGVTRIDPRDDGEKLTAKQEQYAQEFAAEFRNILADDIEESEKARQITALRDEANEDKQVFVAAWAILTAAERKAIKTYIDLSKKVAA